MVHHIARNGRSIDLGTTAAALMTILKVVPMAAHVVTRSEEYGNEKPGFVALRLGDVMTSTMGLATGAINGNYAVESQRRPMHHAAAAAAAGVSASVAAE